jgi:hypothetical protein
MGIHWNRAVIASVLSVGCVTLAFASPGAASASTKAADTTSVLTWSEPVPGGGSNAVSCPVKKFCVTVDNGQAFTYNGKKWSAPLNTSEDLLSVSCASSTFCVAVDAGGQAITYNGSTWSTPAVIDSGNQLNAVSCPSTTFCAAVDSAGNILGYNGTVWTAPVNIDGLNYLSSISCRSTALCVSVDYDTYGAYGHIIQTPGAAAGTVLPIDTSDMDLTSVSCATDTFCVAVDTDGNYMVSSS